MATTALRTYTARPATSATAAPAPVALVAATAKSVLAVLGSSADTINLIKSRISFNGVDGAQVPCLCEIGIISALGTVTSTTPQQRTGSTVATSATAGYNASAEPTYVRIIDAFYIPIFNGHMTEWEPLGLEAQADPSQGFAIRLTAPAVATCLPQITYGE